MKSFHSPVLGDLPDVINIGEKKVGCSHRCYVIAEAGSNHDGSLEKALSLVDAAADAGCDAVKFQTFTGDDIASAHESAETQVPETFRRWGSNLLRLYKRCALPDHFHESIAQHAKARHIDFFSSPFSERAVDRLAKLGVPALKIASFELVHLPLIRYAAATHIPLIISTGMAGLGDIERALDAAIQGDAKQVALLHCGSNYPLGAAGVNLAAMKTLRDAFGVPVGYSDHTLGISVPIAAAALGAQLLEKHITLDRRSDGPDHSFAIEPQELKAMVEGMRSAAIAVGTSRKRRQPEEEAHSRRGRRSIFAARDLKAGDRILPEHIKIVRPGIGIEPFALELIVGRRIVRDIKADAPISWDDILAS